MSALEVVDIPGAPLAVASPPPSLAQWAEHQAAVLQHHVAALQVLQTPLPIAHSAPPSAAPVPAAARLTPLVEGLLRAALGRLDSEAAAARVEFELIMAGAMAKAAVLLDSVGADAATVRRATGGVSLPSPDLAPAPGAPAADSVAHRTIWPAPPRTTCTASATPITPAIGTSAPAAPAAAVPLAGATPAARAADLVADLYGPDEIDRRDPAQVYEVFWADAMAERPVLTRLRRWAQREAW